MRLIAPNPSALLLSLAMCSVHVAHAQCRAPLTVMLAAQTYWEAWIGDIYYEADMSLVPFSSYERVTNITVYVERTTISIGVKVVSSYFAPANTSFIASVSYNGVKLATTGDNVSRWKYMENGGIYPRRMGTTFDDSLWTPADATGLCDSKTTPQINQDGLSYSEFISANGVTPASNTPQYGGETARWIGLNGNNGTCAYVFQVAYRMTLNLTELADEPSCLPKHDARSILSPATPIRRFPSMGRKTATSRMVTFVGSSQGLIYVSVDGISSAVRKASGGVQIYQFDYNIEPKTNNLVAIHVQGYDQLSFIANILYEGQLYAASDNRAQWKLVSGPRNYYMDPGNGWNADPDFDDTTWDDMSKTIVYDHTESESLSNISFFLNKTYGGCANWLDGPNGSVSLYMRIRIDLVNLDSRPALQCPEDNKEKNAPKGPVWSLTDMEIVAIASSATIGSLIIIAAFLFVRRYRARRPKTKTISDLSCKYPSKSKQKPMQNSKELFEWSDYEPQNATTSKGSLMHLADLSAADLGSRPRLMGELQAPHSMRSSGEVHSVASPVQLDTTELSELISAYREINRSAYTRMPGSQQSLETRTLAKTQRTHTDRTLVDRTRQGLEVPGFLQLKQGLHYNLDSKLVSGGGGSLYRGHMSARGFPILKVIVKKMTNASLPAFRQEVALMWLFTDNENMVKLMGFNETQLAIVMPEYKMGSLKRFIDAGGYDIKVARSLLLDIAKGISIMHERGVVHNDIKPDNILLESHPSKRLNALITDFGISNVVEDKVITVKAFDVRNRAGLTVGYAAPEAITRFRSKDRSRIPPGEAKAGDVYSFAIVIHALLAHLRPS